MNEVDFGLGSKKDHFKGMIVLYSLIGAKVSILVRSVRVMRELRDMRSGSG